MKLTTKAICTLVMAFTLLLFAACSNSETQNSSETKPQTTTAPTATESVTAPEAATSIEVSEVPSSESIPTESSEVSLTQAMTFSTLKELFFGTWSPDTETEQIMNQRGDFAIGYGDLSFGDGGRINEWNPLHDAYIDESGNAVLKVNHGGEPYLYTVSPDKPGVMTVASVNGETAGLDGTYTKTAEAGEPTDVFGYMDALELCSSGAEIDLSAPGLFYRNLVVMADGSAWERLATMATPYPTLHVDEKSDEAVTLRSLFYPEGTDLSTEEAEAAALVSARIILFTVSKESAGWETTAAEYYE